MACRCFLVAIAHWEIYKKTINVPGDIVEVGVFKGLSLLRWATFRDISEIHFLRVLSREH